MSLYNMLFGVNQLAPVLLATLGLKPEDVGRFRDAYLDGNHIVIHTRNGGGNRDCWHESDPKWGNATCAGESYEVEVDEVVEVTEEEAKEKGYYLLNVWIGGKRQAKTGKRIMETRHTCAVPASEACGCPGCIINYRLPNHPQYVSDADDDFDSTYADIRFSFPPDYAADLAVLSSQQGEPTKPSEKWEALIASLKAPHV